MNLTVSTIRGIFMYWLKQGARGWQWVSYEDARPHGPKFRSLKAAISYGNRMGDVV